MLQPKDRSISLNVIYCTIYQIFLNFCANESVTIPVFNKV